MRKIYKAKWILPANKKVIKDGFLTIENGVIQNISNNYNPINGYEVIDFGNAIITPGFINLHTHLHLTNLDKKDIPNGFTGWIISLIKKYAKFDFRDKEKAINEGLRSSLKSGTTCVAQISKEKEFFDLFNNSPIKTYLFLEGFSDSEERSKKVYQALKTDIKELKQNKSDNIYLGISPHAPYTCHKDLWKLIAKLSKEEQLLIQTHYAESQDEIDWFKNQKSNIAMIASQTKTKPLTPDEIYNNPVDFLKQFNILDENLILAHCNQMNEEQLRELSGYGVNIAHCPRSNMILHNKTQNKKQAIELFKDKIGLGTDSLYSNNDLNMLNELKTVQKNTSMDVLKLLDLITINPAKILKLDHRIGSLEIGKDADFLVFYIDKNCSYHELMDKTDPDKVYINGNSVNIKNE